MSYTPEKRKELEELRDAIDAALRGEPVQMRDSSVPNAKWSTLNDVSFSGAILVDGMRYRPVPPKVKLRYRRCVRKIGKDELMIDVVTQDVDAVARLFAEPEFMETNYSFVQWLDDDWVEVEIEAPK